MSKAIQLATLAMFVAPLAGASSSFSVTLLSGTGAPDSISVTFTNAGKLPIRWLEFNCKLVGTQANKTERTHEKNALFFPGTVYTAYKRRARAGTSIFEKRHVRRRT